MRHAAIWRNVALYIVACLPLSRAKVWRIVESERKTKILHVRWAVDTMATSAKMDIIASYAVIASTKMDNWLNVAALI